MAVFRSLARISALAALAPALLMLAACDRASEDGPVNVVVIGTDRGMMTSGLRLPYAAQHLRAATAQGLVRLDENGLVVPGIAERWIVTDDGSSYIFRIREFDLPGGKRLTARAVRDSLRRTFAQLDGTSMGLDLTKVRDVRAMTGRVVEIRLRGPVPGLLQLLAQPEMGPAMGDAPLGPMTATRAGDAMLLTPMPPERRGLPEQPGWEEVARTIRLVARDARTATQGFAQGKYDVILGGSLIDFPMAEAGPLSRGTIRLDAPTGLFGFDVRNENGFLASPANREALTMALDRQALIAPFNIGGWSPSTRIVPVDLPGRSANGAAPPPDPWTTLDLTARRAEAAARVAAYAGSLQSGVTLRLGLPEGPGADTLFQGLAEQYAQIGVRLVRVDMADDPDLALRERVARYGGAQWFLNQFNCTVSRAICSADVDFLVELASEARDPAEQASYLAEAEVALSALTVFIPIGAPVRWSMVRGNVVGYGDNAWNLHPLFPLSRAPI